jgi:hypothetical protein
MANINSTQATIDLSLSNHRLYVGCQIEEIAGRLILVTPKEEAVNIIGRNARAIVEGLVQQEVEELTLTGAMSIWAYLIVFHVAVHRFRAIYYDDGRPGGKVLVSVHP